MKNQRPVRAESSASPTEFHLADATVQAHFRTSGFKELYISCSISLNADPITALGAAASLHHSPRDHSRGSSNEVTPPRYFY
jgi:hypothetical protein